MFCERENRILLSTQVIVPSISHWTDALSGLCHWRSFTASPEFILVQLQWCTFHRSRESNKSDWGASAMDTHCFFIGNSACMVSVKSLEFTVEENWLQSYVLNMHMHTCVHTDTCTRTHTHTWVLSSLKPMLAHHLLHCVLFRRRNHSL